DTRRGVPEGRVARSPAEDMPRDVSGDPRRRHPLETEKTTMRSLGKAGITTGPVLILGSLMNPATALAQFRSGFGGGLGGLLGGAGGMGMGRGMGGGIPGRGGFLGNQGMSMSPQQFGGRRFGGMSP